MTYTVKELANLSKISVRTLHFYDEIGLLKPAYHGKNGYRYYEEAELLRLQQILFFRELGFELKKIQKILSQSDYSQITALSIHRSFLKKQEERTQSLIKTIDKTIDHLKGVKKMSNQEIYQGFANEKQANYERYLVNLCGDSAKEFIAKSQENTKEWVMSDYEKLKSDGDLISNQLVEELKAGNKANTPSVQAIIARHYQLIKSMENPTKELYIGMGQSYVEHPDFKEYFDLFDSRLPEFQAEAMKVYAEKELS